MSQEATSLVTPACAINDPPKWFAPLRGEYRAFFVERFCRMQSIIEQVRRDDLAQIIPVVLTADKTIPELRATFGRAHWRHIHHSTEMDNFLKCLIWMKFRDVAQWTDIVSLPRVHLRSCRNAIDWQTAKFAAHLARPGAFSQTAMLYRDTLKMGGVPQPSWSLRRLKREHDRLAVTASIEQACPHPWADPFVYRQDGYVFTRLVSDRDFVVEGKSQRHCIATYRDDARAGTCIAMRCEGAERATYRFMINETTTELSGFANATVSSDCAQTAQNAQRAYLRSKQP